MRERAARKSEGALAAIENQPKDDIKWQERQRHQRRWSRRPPASDKKRAIETAMQQIEKMYGKGSIMRLGENRARSMWNRFPPALWRWTWRWGSAACPRAVLLRFTVRNPRAKPRWHCILWRRPRKQGGEAAFVDAEHALDPTYARALGVNIDDMLISQPDTGEQALEITRGTGALWRASTLWWWTPWRLWCPGRRLKGRWATVMWVSRPG